MKKRDFLLIGSILAGALILLLTYFLIGYIKEKNAADGGYVVVEADGREIARYDLTEDGEYPLNGGTNTLKIENGEAYLIHATCPDKLCVQSGKVGMMKPIVCLPNKLTITLFGGESDVDLVG